MKPIHKLSPWKPPIKLNVTNVKSTRKHETHFNNSVALCPFRMKRVENAISRHTLA